LEKSIGEVRVRVVAITTKDDQVLVVTHSNATESWSCFPGGQLEHGETMEECLVRELQEELSLEIEVEKLIAVGIYEENDTTNLEMYFKCHPKNTELRINETHILDARYISTSSVEGHQVYPLELSSELGVLLSRDNHEVRNYGRFS